MFQYIFIAWNTQTDNIYIYIYRESVCVCVCVCVGVGGGGGGGWGGTYACCVCLDTYICVCANMSYYDMVDIIPVSHNKHQIVRPWWSNMRRHLRTQGLVYVSFWSQHCYIQDCTISERVKLACYDIWTDSLNCHAMAYERIHFAEIPC